MTVSDPTTRAAEMAAWHAHTTAHAHLAAHLARDLAARTGLSEADHVVLDALLDEPDGRMRALRLRWALQWEKSRLSHQVARMAKRGLLVRESCPEDGRGWDIALTEPGREAARRARHVREEAVRTLVLDTLGPERLAGLAATAALLTRALTAAADADAACRAARAAALADE
ncbi:MarR family winged helix-turn-helix transcriptional regulator [Actinomadura flavalba]|uniref:MarR family winged helix-turn-helix transcriptional regulator n=1 Tax=Actinomadura flavalba TaxID=1120938 RepID=UPI00036BF5FA|nr:MarR family transcriptional regulator [Actinomadura flavalba]